MQRDIIESPHDLILVFGADADSRFTLMGEFQECQRLDPAFNMIFAQSTDLRLRNQHGRTVSLCPRDYHLTQHQAIVFESGSADINRRYAGQALRLARYMLSGRYEDIENAEAMLNNPRIGYNTPYKFNKFGQLGLLQAAMALDVEDAGHVAEHGTRIFGPTPHPELLTPVVLAALETHGIRIGYNQDATPFRLHDIEPLFETLHPLALDLRQRAAHFGGLYGTTPYYRDGYFNFMRQASPDLARCELRLLEHFAAYDNSLSSQPTEIPAVQTPGLRASARPTLRVITNSRLENAAP